MSERVIYLVRSWPRLSQTFVLEEVLALERRGLDLVVFSLVRAGEDVVQPRVAEVRAPARYLDDARSWDRLRTHLGVLRSAPGRYVRTLVFSMRRPWLAAGYGECSTLGCFGHAVQVAAAVDAFRAAHDEVGHLHAHFAHDPTLVAMLAARLTGLPYSFTAHARDLYQLRAAGLAARTDEATTVVTCCQANADHIATMVHASRRPPVRVIHHGVDLDRFRPAPAETGDRVPTLVSVGRLVEKKGYADLLTALAQLASTGTPFRCRIYGDGPLREPLRDLGAALGLQDQVTWAGACSSEQVAAALGEADAFVLTPVHTADGDRDGIPNALVEAMACGLPVVTTSAGGVTELVTDEVDGLVTVPGDVTAIAAAVGRVLADAALRARLGAAARRTVERDYDVDAAAGELERVFGARTTGRVGVVR